MKRRRGGVSESTDSEGPLWAAWDKALVEDRGDVDVRGSSCMVTLSREQRGGQTAVHAMEWWTTDGDDHRKGQYKAANPSFVACAHVWHVKLYDCACPQGIEGVCEKNPTFWDELFLLRVNASFLERCVILTGEESLLRIRVCSLSLRVSRRYECISCLPLASLVPFRQRCRPYSNMHACISMIKAKFEWLMLLRY